MSSVDNKVVQLRLDNADFEKNAKESQSTLEKLKDSISGLGGKHSVGQVDTSSIATASDDVNKSIDGIMSQFSLLDTFVAGIFLNLGSKAADFAIDLTKSLTIEMPMMGYDKYETQMKTVSGLKNVAAYQGHDYDELMEALAEISWYADATSYSLDAMSTAMLSAMNAGVDLQTAKTMVMGLGNSFSYAGATATEMQGAFAMWSKALGEGQTLGAMQYRSLEQVYKVITPELKQRFIDMAVEMGRLKKVSGDTWETVAGAGYVKSGGELVSLAGFQGSLADKWLDGAVIARVLSDYGGYTSDVYQYQKAQTELTGEVLTCSEAMDQYDEMLKGAGYEVDEFGRKTLESAMEAKVFSEVIDAIKDAASTQWMSIFQSIFGDYEKAKSMFTDLGDFMSGIFVTPVAELATKFEKWAEIGGRDTLIEGFKALASSVSSITTPIKQAFADTFSPLTAETMLKITQGFKKFAESLAISESTSRALYSVSKLLADVFHLLFDVIGVGLKFVGALINAFSPLTPVLMGIVDWIAKLADAFVKLFDSEGPIFLATRKLQNVFYPLKSSVKNFARSLGVIGSVGKEATDAVTNGAGSIQTFNDAIEIAIGWITKFFESVSEHLSTGFDYLAEKISKGKEGFKEFTEEIQNNRKELEGTVSSSVLGFLDMIIEKFKQAKDAVVNFYESLEGHGLSGKIKNALGIPEEQGIIFKQQQQVDPNSLTPNLDAFKTQMNQTPTYAEQILTYFARILNIGILNEIRKYIGGKNKIQKNINALVESLDDMVNKLTKVFNKIKSTLNFASIKMFAEAVAILTASIAVLALLNPDSVDHAVRSITVVIGELMVVMAEMDRLDFEGPKIAAIIAAFGLCVLEIATALKMVDKLGHPLMALGVLTAILTELMVAFGVMQGMVQESKGGLVAAQAADLFVKLGTMMVLLATAFTMVDGLENIWNSVAVFGAILLEMTIFIGLIFAFSDLMGTGDIIKFEGLATTFIGISVSLLIMASAIALLGALPTATVEQGGVTAGLILAVMGGIMTASIALTKKFGGGAVDMIAFAGSLVVLAIALGAMAAIIVTLGLIPYKTVVEGMTKFIMVIAAIAAALLMLNPFIPVITALAGIMGSMALVLFGVAAACAAFALAVATTTAALVVWGTVGPVLMVGVIETLRVFLRGIVDLAPDFAAAIIGLIMAILIAIDESITGIVEVLVDIVVNIFKTFWNLFKQFIESDAFEKFKGLLKSLWDWLVENVFKKIPDWLIEFAKLIFIKLPKFLLEKGKELIKKINAKIKEGINSFIQAIKDKIKAVKDAIAELVHAIVDKFTSMLGINSPSTVFAGFGENIIDGLKGVFTGTIGKGLKTLKDSVTSLAGALTSKFKEALGLNKSDPADSEFGKAGQNIVDGVDSGMEKKKNNLLTKTISLAGDLINRFKKRIDSNSPSKEFMKLGQYIDEGLIKGIDNESKQVYNTVEDLGTGVISSMAEALNKINSDLDGNIDLSPVITPVLDLSEIQNGAKNLGNLLPSANLKASGISVEGGVSVSAQMSSLRDDLAKVLANSSSGTYTFTQNNYSPKALSRIDIYRQTKNQISMAKGVLVR